MLGNLNPTLKCQISFTTTIWMCLEIIIHSYDFYTSLFLGFMYC